MNAPVFPPDAPLLLNVAVEVAFPGSTMTARGLPQEAEGGRLVMERNAIAEMRKLCGVAMPMGCLGREF
jgi:hypothetical protein